jgi:hypothetical protein
MPPDTYYAPPPPLRHCHGARPDPAPTGRPHHHRALYELGSTPATSSWEVFSGRPPRRWDLSPRRQDNDATPSPPATSGPMGGPPTRTSYATAASTMSADGHHPPTNRRAHLLPGVVTPSSGRGQLPSPPAMDRQSPQGSRAGPTSPAARTAPDVPRRTAFGDLTLDATTIHGITELRRIQAGHPLRRFWPSTEQLKVAASIAWAEGTVRRIAGTPSVALGAAARGTVRATAPSSRLPTPRQPPASAPTSTAAAPTATAAVHAGRRPSRAPGCGNHHRPQLLRPQP